jgi:hypothetical protein
MGNHPHPTNPFKILGSSYPHTKLLSVLQMYRLEVVELLIIILKITYLYLRYTRLESSRVYLYDKLTKPELYNALKA